MSRLEFVGMIALWGAVLGAAVWVYADMHFPWREEWAEWRLHRNFHLDMPIAEAAVLAERKYPVSGVDPGEYCARGTLADSAPAFNNNPCIRGLIELGSTWYGMQIALHFGLYFDSDGKLKTIATESANTWL